jgi:hypothetical protein
MPVRGNYHSALAGRIDQLTELNHRLNAAYKACHGAHVPSGDTIIRSITGLDRMLPICARCGVPFGGPVHYWSSSKGGKR